MASQFQKYSDPELFALLRGSKSEAEAAFTELYNRYSPRIHAYCFRVVDNSQQAEDLFQEAFVRLFQSAKTERSTSNIAGYLMTITRNLCLNYKRDKHETVSLESIDFMLRDESNDYEKSELLNLISTALELLDFEHREAFVLREYDGLSHDEIATLTGATISNVKSRIFRARQKIKDILAPYLKDLC